MPEKTPGSLLAALLRDAAKALAIGLGSGAALALVLFGAGALLGSPRLASGLETAKNGLYLGIALGLFLLAGMLLIQGKKPEPTLRGKGWEAHFRVFSPKLVLGLAAVGWIALAAALDYLAISLRLA